MTLPFSIFTSYIIYIFQQKASFFSSYCFRSIHSSPSILHVLLCNWREIIKKKRENECTLFSFLIDSIRVWANVYFCVLQAEKYSHQKKIIIEEIRGRTFEWHSLHWLLPIFFSTFLVKIFYFNEKWKRREKLLAKIGENTFEKLSKCGAEDCGRCSTKYLISKNSWNFHILNVFSC